MGDFRLCCAAALAAVVAVPLPALADDAVGRARAFVAARQAPGGDFTGAPVPDAAEASTALVDPAARANALFALSLVQPDNYEAALARAAVIAGSPYADLMSDGALGLALSAGDLGLAPGASGTDSLVLATALRLTAADPTQGSVVPAIVQGLALHQRSDGGFGFADEPSDIALTAEIARDFALVPGAPGAPYMRTLAATYLASVVPGQVASLPAADLALVLLGAGDSQPSLVALLGPELLARQEAGGGFDGGDLRATALAVQALRVSLPDLSVGGALVLDTAPATGSDYQVPVVVTNHGRSAAPATTIQWTALAGSTAVASGTATVPGLAPGGSTTVALDLGVQGAVGPRTLIATVNPSAAFAEGGFDDNALTLPFRVADLPDLVVTSADIAGTPTPPTLNQTMVVTARVQNLGDATARNVHMQIVQGDPAAGGTLIGETFFNAVAVGTPRTLTVKIVPASLSPFAIHVRVDPENAIAEQSETNNAASASFTPVPPGELLIDVTSVIASPASVHQGDTFYVQYQAPVTATRFGLPLYPPYGWPFTQVAVALFQGAPATGTLVLADTFSTATDYVYGSYHSAPPISTSGMTGPVVYSLVADPANLIAETNETNNTTTVSINVITDNLPELWVDPASIAATPDQILPGSTYTLSGRLYNTGLLTATNIRVDFGPLGSMQTTVVPALLPGDSTLVSGTFTAPGQAGHLQVEFTVDPLVAITENSKQNNVAYGDVRVAGSDLAVNGPVVQSPDPTPVGTDATFTIPLRNVGVTAGTFVLTSAYLTGGGFVATTTTNSFPAPGLTGSASLTVPTTGKVGDIPLRLTIAPDGNAGSALTQLVTLHVSNPDFSAPEAGFTLTPESGTPGSSVVASVVVNNTGNLTAPASVHLYRGYPERGDLVASGSVSVPAGSSAVFTSASFTTPTAPPYILTVVLDEENAYAEPNEANNTTTRSSLKAPGGLVVAFEESHRPAETVGTNPDARFGGQPGDYTLFAQDLTARGYTVRTINPDAEGLTPEKLLGVDVVIWPLDIDPYTPAEIHLIDSFVRAGGGFLVMTEWGDPNPPTPPWQPAAETFLQQLGWGLTYAEGEANVGGPCTADLPVFSKTDGTLAAHPVTDGVSQILGFAVGGFPTVPQGTQAIATSDASWLTLPATVTAGVAPLGQGRVGFVADTNMVDAQKVLEPPCFGGVPYYQMGNARFHLQLVDYLANRGPGDFLPDLAFVPSAISVSPSVVTAGDSAQLSVTVKNVGGALGSVSGTTVRFYDGTPTTGVALGEVKVPALGVGEAQTVAFVWDTTRSAGDHTITAVVDPDNLVPEQEEGNNTVTLPLTVRAAYDLRIDPGDIVVAGGATPAVGVTVHNLGYLDVAAGTALHVTDTQGGPTTLVGSPAMPLIPARGSATVAVPWSGFDPTVAHTIAATADTVPPSELDATNNSASISVSPPSLAILSPLPGTTWGGQKTVRWKASSEENPGLFYTVALAPAGGSFTGVSTTSGTSFALDTAGVSDGDYVVRVTASDGVLATTLDAPFHVVNAGTAVRTFSSAATVTLPATGGLASFLVPVGSRVDSATLLVDSTSPTRTTVSSTSVYDYGGSLLLERAGGLHLIYLSGGALFEQVSYDDGATWGTPTQLSPAGAAYISLKAAAANSAGIHLVYFSYDTLGPSVYYLTTADGTSWSTPVRIGSALGAGSLRLSATDDGLALFAAAQQPTLATADPAGVAWTPPVQNPGLQGFEGHAAVLSGRLHLVLRDVFRGLFYRSAPLGTNLSTLTGFTAPLLLAGSSGGIPEVTSARLVAADGALAVPYLNWLGSTIEIREQRCDLARDCAKGNSWLPVSIHVADDPYVGKVEIGRRRPDLLQLAWAGHLSGALGLAGGQRYSPPFDLGAPPLSEDGWLFSRDFVATVGRFQALEFERFPGLTPAGVAVDVGSDGVVEFAAPGMLAPAAQTGDFSAAVNAYLSSHSDADDGVIDGNITVPATVTGAGAGQTVLTNLEVQYRPLATIAGYAEPALFSPGASPGVLDTAALSMGTAGAIVITDSTATPVRSLVPTGSGSRFVATFDGRDGSAQLLASGVYGFGSGGSPVASVEIDNLPPIATLTESATGAFGGRVPVHGVATDADFAGTAKNFAYYVLDYTLDGTTYVPIASGTSPATGVLGVWDTHSLAPGSATLRLTVHDLAGNVASTAQSVTVSPTAPAPPVITAPTIAGAAIDSLTPFVTVAGAAEPGTSVTVFVNGVPAGTAPSNGTFSVTGVPLSPGISTITASAARGSLSGASSQPIMVGRYALSVAVSVPSHLAAGSTASATVTLTRTSVLGNSVVVRTTVVDSSGHSTLFTTTRQDAIVSLPAQGSGSLTVTLDPGTAPPGSYRLDAEVVSGAPIAASGSQTFVLDPAGSLAATVVTDRASYDALQIPDLTARVVNAATQSPTGPLTASITVSPPVGNPVVLGPFALGSVPAGQHAAVSAVYGTPPLAVGHYLVDLSVTNAQGIVVATAATDFDVGPANGSGAFAGTLVVNPTSYVPGDVLGASFAVTNNGGAGSFPVSVILVDAVTNAVVSRSDQTLTIGQGATAPGTASLGTTGAAGNDLLALLVASGRGLAGQAVTLSPVTDHTPPTIGVTGVSDGEVRGSAVTPVITISDQSPFTATITLNGQPYTSGTPVTAEGSYTLSVTATDAYNNTATLSIGFAIDLTPPAITVTGVTSGELAGAPRTPAVTFSDTHLRTTQLTLDGLPFVSGTTVAMDGDHTLVAFADDAAGNSRTVTVPFTIDTTPPVISVTGVTAGQVTQQNVTPVYTATDLHLSSITGTLDGVLFASGTLVSSEADHNLVVTASDLVPNTSTVTVPFAIDRTAPVISVTGVTQGQLSNAAALYPSFSAVDPHLASVTATLDGVSFASGSPVSAEGDHALAVSALDLAGNGSTQGVSFTIDRTPPVITVIGVTDGMSTWHAVTPVVTVTDLHGPTWTATMDGSAWTGATVSCAGAHTLVVNAQDAAGNTATQTIHFTIGYGNLPSGSCRHIDLIATKTYNPSTFYDADQLLDPPFSFALPTSIPVIAGNSGNHWITLTYYLGCTSFSCRYNGGSSQAHPNSPAELAKATKYNFGSCTSGAVAGTIIQTDHLHLHLDNGDSYHSPTSVELSATEVSPCHGP
jgi:subtilase family serine protease